MWERGCNLSDYTLNPSDYLPARQEEPAPGIGIVGCGSIVRVAHLPAYQKYGFRVVGAADISEEALKEVREKFGVPFTTTSVDELLAREDVEVIDLAVHAKDRRRLVEKIADAGKPILSQKPFAMSWDEAKHMVEYCERRGVPLMINQQARWAPAHRAVKLLIDRGAVGHIYSVLHVHRSFQDIPGSWYVQLPHFNLVDYGVHFIDLSRYFTGKTAKRVKATTTMMPGQVAVTPMIYTVNFEYEPEAQLMTTLHFNNIVQVSGLRRYEWFIDGTEGSILATHNEVALQLKRERNVTYTFSIKGSWFPDAFAGSMAEMIGALKEGREPQTSGRDNLDTIRMALAAVESSESGRAVSLDEYA